MANTRSAQRPALATEIRVEMARHGYTQRQLAEALGLTQATVSGRMTGKTDFTVSELRHISSWLGVPVSRLLGEPAA
jgi:transcriptional regulator with XRE-family HTH domain